MSRETNAVNLYDENIRHLANLALVNTLKHIATLALSIARHHHIGIIYELQAAAARCCIHSDTYGAAMIRHTVLGQKGNRKGYSLNVVYIFRRVVPSLLSARLRVDPLETLGIVAYLRVVQNRTRSRHDVVV